ncbi:MAG: phosphatidate cytidylyltransferase [Homoserinimonas sp.]|jgi:phosphatidate cytidylyltransferase|nr:phosphatidate cytidylyltransferase [Homoserinimonas sp.]
MSDSREDSAPTSRWQRRKVKRAEFEVFAHATAEDLRAQFEATRAQLDATNEKIEARVGRNLLAAVAIGLALGVAMLLSLIVIKELFMVLAGILVAFTAFELASALRFAGHNVPRIPTVIAALAIVPAAFYFDATGQWLVILAGIAFVTLWRVAELARPSHRVQAKALLEDVGAGALVQVYVPFLASFAVLLTAQEGGEWWTLAFLVTVIAIDTGAYASGLAFGRHKMAPRISPAKTWEGFAGATVTAVVAGILLAILMLQESWWVGVIFGLTMVLTATVGDLTESLIKRDLGIKDISTWLPGHGGFLDRLDSILPSAAAAYILFMIFT